jgi:uncharacterized protein YchJ
LLTVHEFMNGRNVNELAHEFFKSPQKLVHYSESQRFKKFNNNKLYFIDKKFKIYLAKSLCNCDFGKDKVRVSSKSTLVVKYLY